MGSPPTSLDPRPLLALQGDRSDTEFAKLLGVDRLTIRRWRGGATPHRSTAERAAGALGRHPGELWSNWTVSKEPNTLPALGPRPGWQEHAKCRGIGAENFYFSGTPGGGQSSAGMAGVKRARQMCAECPVREQCLEEALSHADQHGIWAGTSQRERNRILKQRRQAARKVA